MLEVEKPSPILLSGILYIFEYYSFCSQESIEYFLSLDLFKSLESFDFFFFFLIFKETKIQPIDSLPKGEVLVSGALHQL